MISVVVCTYNREKYLYGALENIARNSLPKERYEVVLVDNNSTDGTAALCARFHEEWPEVDFRYFVETQQGLSHARNRGIAEARGEVLVFLDDDSFVEPDYLEQLSRQLEAHPDAMAFGGKITPLFEDGVEPAWLCRWTLSWVSAIDLGGEVRRFGKSQYPIGANMGFRKSCLDSVGGFNTLLGRSKKNMMGGEEKDIFGRVRDRGYAIYYFPDILVRHMIPRARTTREYIVRLAEGNGMSERLRCTELGGRALAWRKLVELEKWCGTLVLDAYYLLCGRPEVSRMITLFRWHVSRGLFNKHLSQ